MKIEVKYQDSEEQLHGYKSHRLVRTGADPRYWKHRPVFHLVCKIRVMPF